MTDSPPCLLLCEDDPSTRRALGLYLRKSGYAVEEAADGGTAIRQLKSQKIDLLLLDLQMPGGDGFAVLNYVHEHRQALPVILLTGLPPDQIQDRMQSLKRRELPPLLMKPINPEQVIQLVELQLAGQLPLPPHASSPPVSSG